MPRKQPTRSTPSRASKGGIRALERSLQFLTKTQDNLGRMQESLEELRGIMSKAAEEPRREDRAAPRGIKATHAARARRVIRKVGADHLRRVARRWRAVELPKERERRGAADNVPTGCHAVLSTRSGLSRRMTMKTGRGNRSSLATTRSFGNGQKNGEPARRPSRVLKTRPGHECCVLIFRDTAERNWKRSLGKSGSSHSTNET
jgi:hypothetical protein